MYTFLNILHISFVTKIKLFLVLTYIEYTEIFYS